MVEVKRARQLLRRGVHWELYVAPVLVIVPLVVGWLFVDAGFRTGSLRLQALGFVVLAGNLVFDFLMLVTALRFLRETPVDLGPEQDVRKNP